MTRRERGVEGGDFECQVSGVKFQVSGVKFQVSGVKFQVSGVKFQVSGVKMRVDEERKMVVGPDREAMEVSRSLVLGVEKFRQPFKNYRLIWVEGREAWLCEEDKSRYRRKYGPGGVVEAGRKLAEGLGVLFSEVTR